MVMFKKLLTKMRDNKFLKKHIRRPHAFVKFNKRQMQPDTLGKNELLINILHTISSVSSPLKDLFW